MSEAVANDMQRYIDLVHGLVAESIKDVENAAVEELIDFWMTWVYWELQLYSGLQMGIEVTWNRIQTQAKQIQPSVLNIYTAFRFRGGVDQKEWAQLVQLLAASGSLKAAPTSNMVSLATKVVNKDIWERSLEPSELEQLLQANCWMVPILLYKMGPRPITVEKKRRS